MRNVPKWSEKSCKCCKKMLEDFLSVSDEFRTLCIKGLNISPRKYTKGHWKGQWPNKFNRKEFHWLISSKLQTLKAQRKRFVNKTEEKGGSRIEKGNFRIIFRMKIYIMIKLERIDKFLTQILRISVQFNFY